MIAQGFSKQNRFQCGKAIAGQVSDNNCRAKGHAAPLQAVIEELYERISCTADRWKRKQLPLLVNLLGPKRLLQMECRGLL